MIRNNKLLNKSISLILGFYIMTTGCFSNPQKKVFISFVEYPKWELFTNTNPQYLTLINAYPFVGSVDKRAAYLFVCQDGTGKDSLFVFDMKPQNSHSISSNNKGEGFLLDINGVANQGLKDVIVNVPADFVIPAKIKVAFGTLSHAVD